MAILFGLLDSSSWVVSYGWGDPNTGTGGASSWIYYALAISLKAAILLVFIRILRLRQARILWPFFVPIMVSVLASILMQNAGLEGVVQPVGMLASLASTLAILGEDNLELYAKAFGLSCLMACAAFFFQLYFIPIDSPSGLLDLGRGRYSFISGTQPNLGGEIMLSGFIAICIARLSMVVTVTIFGIFFAGIYLLESRAAMLSLLLSFVLYFYFERIRWLSLGTRLGLLFVLLVAIALFCTFNMDKISGLFQLDDEYRGLGTGYVGREDHWEAAWEAFVESPFVGVGFGYFRQDVVTPHSMWLAMLSMMGLLSVFTAFQIFQNGRRVYRANMTMFLLLISFAPMTVFNDRFLNLNAYPFLFFLLLFLPRGVLMAWRTTRAPRRYFAAATTLQPRQFGGVREGAG